MHPYRLEYASLDPAAEQPQCFEVPSISTALLVAEMNANGRTAEVWEGSKRLARLERQDGARGSYWRVSAPA